MNANLARSIILATTVAVLACGESYPAAAQSATLPETIVVSDCSALTLVAGKYTPNYVDTSRNACFSQTVALPTGAATAANQTAVQGSVSGGTAATKSQLAGGIYNTTAPALTNGQQSAFQMTSNGGINTSPDDVVDGGISVAASASGAGVLTNTPIATVGFPVVDVDVTTNTATLNAQSSWDGGTTYITVPCKSKSAVSTFPGTSLSSGVVYECPTGDHFQLSQTGAGSTAARVLARRYVGSVESVAMIGGNVGSGASDSGNPAKIGGKVNTSSVSCTNGQRCDAQSAENGALINKPFAAAALQWQSTVTLSDGTNTQIHASCGAGLKNYAVALDWSSLSTTVADELDLNDNATAIWKNQIPAGASGRAFIWEIGKQGSAATAMNVQLTGSPTGAVTVNVSGYCAP